MWGFTSEFGTRFAKIDNRKNCVKTCAFNITIMIKGNHDTYECLTHHKVF